MRAIFGDRIPPETEEIILQRKSRAEITRWSVLESLGKNAYGWQR